MKKVLFLILLLSATTLIFSCSKKNEENNEPGDYLIFGHFYGECIGESCIEIYCLESTRLLEDENDNYPGQSGFYIADFYKLPQGKYEEVKSLINFFPDSLLLENDIVIGQPDAGDWGGLYIEYNYDGKRKFWLLDQKKSNVPTYLHEFIDKVNESIELINN